MPTLLWSRDMTGDFKTTLSSWDKCMAKTYCKWPVIVAIIVGSLIVLSVVLCIARCICCGAECACCCFKCCSCCCPSGRGSGHKRMKSAPPPTYPTPTPFQPTAPPDGRPVNAQYRSHAAPAFAPAAAATEKPQFARFDASAKPVNEDSLPAMPSWKDANSYKVEEEVIPEKKGDMEMNRLDHNGSVAGSVSTGMAAAAVAGARSPARSPGRSPIHRSPTQDSYGFPQGYQTNNDSPVGGGPQRSVSPYSGSQYSSQYSNGPSQYGQQQDGYRGVSPLQSRPPVHAFAGAYDQNQYGRSSPNPRYNNRPPPARQNSGGYGSTSPTSDYLQGAPQNGNYGVPSTRAHSPGYAPSGSTRYEPSVVPPAEAPSPAPAPAYPGQQTYQTAAQPNYQAYQPTRKPVDGSWKDV